MYAYRKTEVRLCNHCWSAQQHVLHISNVYLQP